MSEAPAKAWPAEDLPRKRRYPRAVTVLFHESCRLASLPARHLLVVVALGAHRRRPWTNRPTETVAAGHHLCDDRLHHRHDSTGRRRTCAKHLRSCVLRQRGGNVHHWRPGMADEGHHLRTVVLNLESGSSGGLRLLRVDQMDLFPLARWHDANSGRSRSATISRSARSTGRTSWTGRS